MRKKIYFEQCEQNPNFYGSYLRSTLLLKSIRQCDKSGIQHYGADISLKDFAKEHIREIPPKALEFLHTDCAMDLNFYEYPCLSENQWRVVLKHHEYPSAKMILEHSAYFDLTLFKLLFEYGVKIPEKVVYEWRVPPYRQALQYYLKHNGNPNVRPFHFKKESDIFFPSLIDWWISMQGQPGQNEKERRQVDRVVHMLKAYGAKQSPYAMTWKQREKYDRMQLEHPDEFVLKYKNKVDQLRKNLKNISKDGDDASLYDEYCWCIKRYEEDIKNAQLLIPEPKKKNHPESPVSKGSPRVRKNSAAK